MESFLNTVRIHHNVFICESYNRFSLSTQGVMTALDKQDQAQLETDRHKKFIGKIAQGLQSWNEVFKFTGTVMLIM